MSDVNDLPEEEFGPEAEFEAMPEFPDEDENDSWMDDVDPATIVTIRPSSGEAKYQVVDEPTSLSILMQRAGLTYNGQLDAYVEGAPITLDALVQGGQTVVLIGNVKGGM
jgi:hypothetical protein